MVGLTLSSLFSQSFRVRNVFSRWTFYKKCFFCWDTKKMSYIQNWWTIPLRPWHNSFKLGSTWYKCLSPAIYYKYQLTEPTYYKANGPFFTHTMAGQLTFEHYIVALHTRVNIWSKIPFITKYYWATLPIKVNFQIKILYNA